MKNVSREVKKVLNESIDLSKYDKKIRDIIKWKAYKKD